MVSRSYYRAMANAEPYSQHKRNISEAPPHCRLCHSTLTLFNSPLHLSHPMNSQLKMTSSSHDRWLITMFDIKLLNPTPSNGCTYTLRAEITGSDKVSKPVEEILFENQVSDEQIHLDVTPQSTIVFTVLKNRYPGRKKGAGRYEISVSSLFDMQKSSGLCQLSEGELELSFTIKDTLVQDALNEVIEQIKDIHFNERESWFTFFTYFKMVKDAISTVSGLNPYAQKVWNVLLLIPDSIEAHLTRNSNINQLCERLKDIYKFVIDAGRLPVFTITQTENLKLLFRQTLECVHFVKDYNDSSTAKNFLKGPIIDNKVQEFQKSLDRLFDAIQRSLKLEIDIVVYNMLDLIHNFNLLSELPYTANAGFQTEKKCLPGTREKLINNILDWVNTDTIQRVLILSGQAGMGKSAIAHTVYENLKGTDKLSTIFCFNRSDQSRRNSFFSTISRNLADDALWLQNLVQFSGETEIRKSLDPTTQFNELIVKPSKSTTKPVVIIIDALDESGDRETRRTLLDLLFKRTCELPQNYRLIITSRPESDIEQKYNRELNVLCIHMANIDPDDTLNDIQKYISSELSDVAEILDKRFHVDWRSELAEKAQGLFQWAYLACHYIVEYNHIVRLKTLLSKAAPASLFEMYHKILDDKQCIQDKDSFTTFQTIIGALIVSREPFSIATLKALFEPLNEDLDVKAALAPFRSLFIGVDGLTTIIRPLHTSLLDFFISAEQKPKTPNRYYIDTSDQASVTHACLRLMNVMLRFNMCDLDTSHRFDSDVENFESLVKKAIPEQLSYACCHWAYHLKHSRLDDSKLLKEIHELMEQKLLYFFEALSLLGEVEHGCVGMRILEDNVKDKDNELAYQAADAYRFGREFGDMMQQSTPHLYLSALPFTSKDSFIYKQFIHIYSQTLHAEVGQSLVCPRVEYIMVKPSFSAMPRTLAFSPKDTQIATGFDDGEFWMWNYITGEIDDRLVSEEGQIGIDNVVFSPDGGLVYRCYNDGIIETWDTETNVTTAESYKFTQGECRGCTISSDGQYIAFALMNSAVLLHDNSSDSTHTIEDSCNEHYIMSFSPDGHWFALRGKASRLWNTRTRTFFLTKTVPEPSIRKLLALANNYIAIEKKHNLDSGVEIWDLRTNARVSSLAEEVDRRRSCHDAIFTPDERYFLNIDTSNILHIHDISTGDLIIRVMLPRLIEPPSLGYSDFPRAIVVSPDCRYIALSMSDDTMRILTWDSLVKPPLYDKHDEEEKGEKVLAVWLKGHYVLLHMYVTKYRGHSTRILDTTKRLNDHKIHNSRIVAVSPEDDHWSIAYTVKPRGLYLWDIDGRKEITLDKTVHHTTPLAFSPTGDCLIVGELNGNIKIWDVLKRQLTSISRLPVCGLLRVDALAFSSMGTTFTVAYTTSNEQFYIEERDWVSKKLLRGPFLETVDFPTVRPIIFPSDNKHIVCMLYRSLKIFDVSTGASACFDTISRGSRFSPNRKYVAWVPKEKGNEMKLWDLETDIMIDGPSFGEYINESYKSCNDISNFDFSADSTLLCISHGNSHLKHLDIWDIGTGKLITRPLPLYNVRDGENIALHGDSLFSTVEDGSGKTWDFRVLKIMESLYDDHLNKSQFGMLPANIDTMETIRRSIEDYRLSCDNTETWDYTLKAWNNAIFSPYTEMDEGWMLGPHGELLFWVPPRMRSYLWRPSMSYSVDAARDKIVKLEFDKFVHGTSWKKCKTSCT